MITGMISLNNLTDQQLTQVMQLKDRYEGKLHFPLNKVQQNIGPNGKTLNSFVELSWNDESGFKGVIELSNLLLGIATESASKSA